MDTIELDDRRRAPLAKLARDEDSTFLVQVDPATGRITLTPAVTISKDQHILNSSPSVLEAIDQVGNGQVVRRPRPERKRS